MFFSNILLILFTLVNAIVFVANAQTEIECDTPFNCSEKSVFGGNVLARGYKSLSGSTTSIDNTAIDLRADGAFAAYQLGFAATQNMFIYGANGIYEASGPIAATNNIGCYGSNSCSYTEMQSDASNTGYISCIGQESCKNSIISDTATIYGYGAYSLMNSIIYGPTTGQSGGSSEKTRIELRGYYAGYNLTIHQTSGNPIYLNCYGNGCNGTRIICGNETECIINCANASDPSIIEIIDTNTCPFINNTKSMNIDLAALNENEWIINSEYLSIEYNTMCDDSGDIEYIYDNFNEDSSNANSINNTIMCCRGSYSCNQAGNVTINNGNSIFSGYSSFSDSLIGTSIEMKENSKIASESTNNTGVIWCSGMESCKGATLNTENSIYCGAYRSCANTMMLNADILYCSGSEQSCGNSEIGNIKNIYVTGSKALENSVIKSGNNRITMNIYLLAYQGGFDLTIYCDIKDYCNIYCITTQSCNETITRLNCFNNNCYYKECDYENYDYTCVNAINSIAPTSIPTIIPTEATELPTGATQDPTVAPSNPTDEPTFVPSYMPSGTTREPTVTPSNEPSNIPTRMPISPSLSPSEMPNEITIMPSELPTQMPFNEVPTEYPTVKPTGVPTTVTNVPSNTPSNNPTLNGNTEVPSIEPTQLPTTQGDKEPTTAPVYEPSPAVTDVSRTNNGSLIYNSTYGNDTHIDDELNINEAILGTIDNVATYFALGVVGILLIVILLRTFHNICWSGSDAPDYGSVIRFVHSVTDFWTDVLFAYTMYLYHESKYFLFSAIFTVVPLLFSLILAIYWIFKWRTMTAVVPQRIADYLKLYSISLIVFTVMGNFPSAVSFCQSKLFHHPMFTFPLMNKENERLYIWKFINTTILENLPQLVIQVSYVMNAHDDSISLLVGFSLVLTILGLLFSLSATAVIVLKLLVEHNKHVRQVTEIGTKMTIVCDHFKWKHGYTHYILEEAIKHTLRTCNNSKFWIDRSDVQLSIEVFYISNNISLAHSIDVYFETLLTCYTIDSDNDVPSILLNTINNFGNFSSFEYKTLIQSYQTQMKLHGKYKTENVTTLYKNTSNQDGEMVLGNVKSTQHLNSIGSLSNGNNGTNKPMLVSVASNESGMGTNMSAAEIELAVELAKANALTIGGTPGAANNEIVTPQQDTGGGNNINGEHDTAHGIGDGMGEGAPFVANDDKDEEDDSIAVLDGEDVTTHK